MNKKNKKYPKPKLFVPDKQEFKNVANTIAKHLSNDKFLKISDDEFIQGKINKSDDFLNWVALSKFLTGGRMSIRRNRVPFKHQEKINELIKLIDNWKKKYKN